MKAYYGSRISPNMTETNEGYLVCHNVPIARTGKYEYLGSEIGADTNDVVPVFRDGSEVFSPAAMSSFNGKPVTDDHPPVAVDPDNVRDYQRGVVTNVRQGKGTDADLLLADLIIHDQRLIDEIRQGKREVSAGYECEYVPNGDGTYSQTGIIGNHVAVVDAGRAGHRIRINDAQANKDYPTSADADYLVSLVDAKAHNHLDEPEIRQSLAEGGESYVLRNVNPSRLKVEYHESLSDEPYKFDPATAKPIIVGKDGFVIDGRHRVMAAISSNCKTMKAYVPKKQAWMYVNDSARVKDDDLDAQAEKAARHYGISVKRDGHRSPPEGYPSDREQYADPVNYKYPLTGEHKRAAVVYYNDPKERAKGGYTSAEWTIIGRRIVRANGEGYELQDGHIITPEDRAKTKARDSRMSVKLPLRKKSRVTDMLAAIGLKHYALDADPEDLKEAVDELVNERTEDEEGGNDFPVPTTQESKSKAGASVDEAPAATQGDDDLKKELAELKELVMKALAGKAQDEKTAEETLDEELKKLDGDDDEEESKTVEPEDMTEDEDGVVLAPEDRPENPITGDSARALKRAVLRELKPVIAAIPDEQTRKKVVMDTLARFQGRSGANVYGQMARDTKARVKGQQKAAKAQEAKDYSELGMEIARKHNPHYKNK